MKLRKHGRSGDAIERALNAEIEAELDHHLHCLEDEYRIRGHSGAEATTLAQRRFGPVVPVWRECRRLAFGSRRESVRRWTMLPLAAFVIFGTLLSWQLAATRESFAVALAAVSASWQAHDERPLEFEALTRAQRLNRHGDWREAVSFVERELAKTTWTTSQRAALLGSCVHAHLCLRDANAARRALDAMAKITRELEGTQRTTARLRGDVAAFERRLAKLTAVAKPKISVPVDDWKRADPKSLGIDPTVLEEHRQLCERTGADGCVVVRHGKIAREWRSERFRPPTYAMSSTKSITGLLAGMLIDAGKLGLDDRVGKYLPEWREGRRGAVTVAHLLSMTSGLDKRTGKGDGAAKSVGFVGDKNAFVRALIPDREPGSAWSYSNEGVQLLSPVLDAAAGEPIQRFAKRKLFTPLGMNETRLHLDTAGHAWTYADMETTSRDMARIGLLMLNHGRVGERQIVSRAWCDRSTKPSQPYRTDYGLLWWLNDLGYSALGYLNTDIHVFPKFDLVIVRTQSKAVTGAATNYREELLRLVPRLIAER